ncbi:MAG TPA: hypothetical protein VMU37_10940 [Caulobacteraceae bacterium]|nr:hypothetical protein [Caulobacteraceae bacterium]
MLKQGLVRDLVAVTLVKLALLFVLYLLFFSPSHREPINPGLHIADYAGSPAATADR